MQVENQVMPDMARAMAFFGGAEDGPFVMINLLKISEARELIVPAKVADSSAGQRLMFTVRVSNVDEVCGKLNTLGVQLLNGPQDRPWGRRTAAFADPAGHVWELAHEI